jgi:hypothetical protein
MLLPNNRSAQVAAPALAQSIGRGILLGNEGYRREEPFGWLYGDADTLRVIPSDD